MVVCEVSDPIQLRYNLAPRMQDNGSKEIKVLPNGLTSVSSVAFCVIY